MAGAENIHCLHLSKDLLSMIDNFLDKVSDTIGKFNMFDKSERLLVCLSGGADSVSLLLCLKKLGYRILACHINHQLRGEESERDQQFCEHLCKSLEIELRSFRIDVKGFCTQHSLSVEEGARLMRYEIFAGIPCDKICTAHTLSDCIETTVFNLARGTGLKGLCSIPPKRDNIVRPLIECTRQEIIGFLSELDQEYVTDSTNLEDEYTRNRIRHNVIPQLESINPSLLKSYSMTLEHLRHDEAFLEKTAREAYEKCYSECGLILLKFCKLDECIKDRVLMLWLNDEKIAITHERLALLRETVAKRGKLNIASGKFIIVENGKITVSSGVSVRKEILPVNVSENGDHTFGSRNIRTCTMNIDDIDTDISNVHKMFANCCLDYDKIKGGLVIHKRGEGDTIRLVNRGFASSVRKLVNKAFDLSHRDNVVIMYDDEGTVFVEGYGVDERVKITSDTKRILTFEITDII